MMEEASINDSRNRYQGDENLLVRFFTGTRPDHDKSEQEGRPIFKDVPWIEIRIPGDRDNVYRPANQMDYDRFPEHYKRYLNRESEEVVIGTPLEEWPPITRSQVEELRFVNVRSVEQLASLSDANAQGLMGINTLRQKAKDFIESKDENAEALQEAQDTIQALMARVEQLEADKPKRGRPRKTEEATE